MHIMKHFYTCAAFILMLLAGTTSCSLSNRQNYSNSSALDIAPETAAVSTVGTDDKVFSNNNIMDFFRTVPGLTVIGNKVSVRGINSVNSGTDPLILVDGVECDDLSTINVHDIENVTVLKDSASTVIYGFRGSKGVILITTKAAKAK